MSQQFSVLLAPAEEALYQGAYSSATTYFAGQIVEFAGYQSIEA